MIPRALFAVIASLQRKMLLCFLWPCRLGLALLYLVVPVGEPQKTCLLLMNALSSLQTCFLDLEMLVPLGEEEEEEGGAGLENWLASALCSVLPNGPRLSLSLGIPGSCRSWEAKGLYFCRDN